MNKLLSIEEGRILTKFARQSIERYVRDMHTLELPQISSKALFEHRGVFVTLKTLPQRELRGCIGFLQPGPKSQQKPLPLLEATQQAALNSALRDPRFPPLQAAELEQILVEVSVLTIPEALEVDDRKTLPSRIIIGKHGLIIEGEGWHRGLLLPQVAPEQDWDAEEFLNGCCRKAGLGKDCYLDQNTRIFVFQAQIFAEETVKGKIRERTF